MSTLRNIFAAPSHRLVEGIDGSQGVDARKRHFPHWGVPDATAAAIVGREHRTHAGTALQEATDAAARRRHAMEEAHKQAVLEHIAAEEKHHHHHHHHHPGASSRAAAAAPAAARAASHPRRSVLRMPQAATLLDNLVRWVRRARAAIVQNAHAAAAAAGGIHLPGLPVRQQRPQERRRAPIARRAATPSSRRAAGLHLPVLPSSMAAIHLPAFPAARRALRRLRLRIARAGFELPSLPSLRNMHLNLPRMPSLQSSLQSFRALRHGAPAGPLLAAGLAIDVVSIITLANIFGARANLSSIGALLSRGAGDKILHGSGLLPMRLLRAMTAKLPVSNETWYKMLARPAWAPALSANATAWNATRVFVALALYRLLTAATRGRGPLRLKALKAFAVQMVMGVTCALCTLAFRSTAIGLAHHILACFTVAACVAAFGKFDALSGILLLPLAAMVAAETLEQIGVTYAN